VNSTPVVLESTGVYSTLLMNAAGCMVLGLGLVEELSVASVESPITTSIALTPASVCIPTMLPEDG